jgi:hypothetical protein
MDALAKYDVVWRMYFRADKDPASILQASAVWLCAPRPVDALLTGAAA